MKLAFKAGTTSKLLRFFVSDSSSTTGAGLTGLTSASGSLTAYYCKEGDSSATAITLSAGTLGTWSSGGFVAVDGTNLPGLYEMGIPNAALTTAKSVVIMLKGATNMTPVLMEIELHAVDNQDAIHFGLTGIPNAAAGANGGLPLGNASGFVTVATNNDKTGYAASTVSDKTGYSLGTSQTFNTTGSVGSVTGAVGSVTGNVGGSVGSVTGAVGSVTGAVGSVAGDVSGKVIGGGAGSITGDGVRAASVTGAVGSVTGAVASVTAGVALTSGEHTAIAADVLNATAASYNTAGSIGQKINSAGTAGDPLTAAVPGSYSTGTAGAALGKIGTPAGASLSADIAAVKTSADTAGTTAAAVNTKLGTPAGASVSADIAAKPTAAAIATAVWAQVADGSVTTLQGMTMLIASMLGDGTNTYDTNTATMTTVKKRQDNTTTAYTTSTVYASGTAAPAPQSVTVTNGTLS